MFFLVCFMLGVRGHNRLPVGGILYVHETQRWLRELENVTRASTKIELSKFCEILITG